MITNKKISKSFSMLALWLGALLLFTTSCNKPLTEGEIICETRNLSYFNKIHISDNLNISIEKSDSCYIEITAGENLIPNIGSYVVDKVLFIENNNIGNMFRENKSILSAVIYHNSDINEIYYHSIGDLRSSDYINNDSLSTFDFNIEDGSGDINLKIKCYVLNLNYYEGSSLVNIEGSSNTINIYRKGLGPIHLENMPTKIADIMLFRGNDIYVECHDSLNGRIYDFGNIYYKGHPKISSYIAPDALGRILSINN